MKQSCQPSTMVSEVNRILLGVALTFSLYANAATVICTNLVDSLGVSAGTTRVTFTPQPVNGRLIPQQYSNQTVLPKVVGANCDTNSAFSATIIAGGYYSISFLPFNVNTPPVTGLVPSNTNATYTLNQVIGFATNQNSFGTLNIWGPFAAGTNVAFRTNSGLTYIDAVGGGGGGSGWIPSSLQSNNINGALTNSATGNHAFSPGGFGSADGFASVAIGYNSTAANQAGIALGQAASVSGDFGIALGVNASATGQNSIALGQNVTASDDNTIIIGNGGGKVGIGMEHPAYYLDVDGDIHTTGTVRGDNGGVFQNTLTLNGANVVTNAVADSNAVVSVVGGTVHIGGLPYVGVTNGASGVTLTGTFSGNGSGLTNIPPAAITNAPWLTSGNVQYLQFGSAILTNISHTGVVTNTAQGVVLDGTFNENAHQAAGQNLGSLSFVGSGNNNGIDVNSPYSFIGDGWYNNMTGSTYASIVGGKNNVLQGSGNYVFIGGGYSNEIYSSSPSCSIVGGEANSINGSANQTFVGGGYNNLAGGTCSTIAGGNYNRATANYTFAAGSQANATNANSFVWSDGTPFGSTETNQYVVHAGGGIVFNTTNTGGAASFTLNGVDVGSAVNNFTTNLTQIISTNLPAGVVTNNQSTAVKLAGGFSITNGASIPMFWNNGFIAVSGNVQLTGGARFTASGSGTTYSLSTNGFGDGYGWLPKIPTIITSNSPVSALTNDVNLATNGSAMIALVFSVTNPANPASFVNLTTNGLVVATGGMVSSNGYNDATGTLPAGNTILTTSGGYMKTNGTISGVSGTLPVASLPIGLTTNTLIYNGAVIPTNITKTPLSANNIFIEGDSVAAGYNSGVPTTTSGLGYSFIDYFWNLVNSNYAAVGNSASPFSFYGSRNSGWTIDYLFNCAGGSNNVSNPLALEAMVADIGIGNANSTFTTPDAYVFNILTNWAFKNMVSGNPTIIFTGDNFESGAAWTNNNFSRFTNAFNIIYNNTYFCQTLTNLSNYAGTNTAGYVVTTNSMTWNQFQTYLYNLNVAIVNFCAKYGNGYTNLGIVRLDTSPAVFGSTSPDGWHPNFTTQIEIGKRFFNTYFNHVNDFAPVPIPAGLYLISNGFGSGTLSATIPLAQLPAAVVTNGSPAITTTNGNYGMSLNGVTLSAGYTGSTRGTLDLNGGTLKMGSADGNPNAICVAVNSTTSTTISSQGYSAQATNDLTIGLKGNLVLTTYKSGANTGGNIYVSGIIGVTNAFFLATNATAPTGLSTGGYLWNSNNALYWITSSHTNLLSAP